MTGHDLTVQAELERWQRAVFAAVSPSGDESLLADAALARLADLPRHLEEIDRERRELVEENLLLMAELGAWARDVHDAIAAASVTADVTAVSTRATLCAAIAKLQDRPRDRPQAEAPPTLGLAELFARADLASTVRTVGTAALDYAGVLFSRGDDHAAQGLRTVARRFNVHAMGTHVDEPRFVITEGCELPR